MRKALQWKYLIASLISCFIIFSNNVSAQCRLLNETFDVNPVLSPTDVDGTWYPDRFRPAGFASAVLGGNNVLKISIDGIADGALNRPSGQQGSFYNTQGRKFNQCGGCVTVMKGDLWIPADWANNRRRSDMWATAFDATNNISAYPIIGFRNTDGASPGIYCYDIATGLWINSGVAIAYDSWYSLQFRLVGTNLEYLVNNVVVVTLPALGSSYFGNIIMQAYNFNDPALPVINQSTDSYDAYWDNLVTTGTSGNIVTNINTGQTYCSIQAAISSSSTLPGHTIEVGPGTYNENVTINKNDLVLRSSGGKAVTTIQGITTPGAGAVMVSSGTNGVTIGQPGKGFTIIGFDGNGAIESAALYLLGTHTNITIEDNEIQADGDHGLLSNFNADIDGIFIKNNMFTGKTFLGTAPGGCGFGTQFDPGNNVPRQLVTLGGGSTPTLSKNVYFLNNTVTGTAGGFNADPGCAAFGQGNNLVTIDVIGCTISGNIFNGITTRFSNSLRARGQGASIFCNTFINGGLGLACGNIFLGTAIPLGGGASPSTLAGIASSNSFPSGGAYITPTGASNWVIYRDLAQATAALTPGQTAVPAAAAANCPVVNINTGMSFATIQSAISSPFTLNGHTIQVGAGMYNEDVVINKSLTLHGAGCGSTTVSGPIGGGGATMQVLAAGVVIDGFTITRDGNNTTDWNSALNSAGVAIQSQGNYAEVRNCCITGNRTGIDINNSNGNNIHDNLIDNNRTGLLFRNQTDNTNVQNNFVTNNWTVGILFLDASGGSNVPVQSAANSTFGNNDISGNWYGEVVDRQTGGSLPAPGANAKNFECNWYGAATAPVTSVANSTEPGYAAQIPVIYGGIAVPPGGQPDILGTASANIDYTPWLVNGTDNSGASGFQPVANSCGGGTPQLNTTINGVTVNSNNDGNDDLATLSVCPGTGNIQFNLYADQNGLVHPQYKVYQTLTTLNVSVPFCNNCWATMAAFTGASGTATLVNPSMTGTLTMRFKAWIDLNNDGLVDLGEPQGDWIQYTMTVNPRPILRQTYNGVQVTANNDGVDDQGSFTICSSASDNVFLTEITDVRGITPSASVKVEQVVIKTNVTINTAADGVYPLASIGPIPLGRTATLINPAMNGTVVIKRRAFYDTDNSNTLNAGDCAGDWVVYTITLDGEAPVLAAAPPAVTVQCIGDVPAMTNLGWTDNRDGSGSVAGVDGPLVGGICGGTITRTWNFTDACGNVAVTRTQIITVNDNTAPVLTVPADVTAECTSVPPVGVATATDNCNGSPSVVLFSQQGTPSPIHTAYTGARTTGNQNYSDRLGMVFNASVPIVITSLGAYDDQQNGLMLPITVGIVRESDGATMAGPITMSGTADPLDGYYRMRTIPSTILPPGNYIIVAVGYGNAERNGNSNNGGPAAVFNSGGVLTSLSSPYGGAGFGKPTTAFPTPSIFHAGTFKFFANVAPACPVLSYLTRTWRAMDDCGNASIKSQTITVEDNTGPVLTVPADVTLECSDPLPLAPLNINSSPNNLNGTYNFGNAIFGPALTGTPVTGDAVLVDDGIGNTADGCQPIINSLSGKIAIVDRGLCPFTVKVLAAQNQGAVGVIVVNNIPGDNVGTMGGTDPLITIPSIFVSNNYGNALKAEMLLGNVNISLSANPLTVSDCTTTVITHSQVITPGACAGSYSILNTWTATDACGNPTTQSQTITVQDTQAPVLAGIWPANVTGVNACLPAGTNAPDNATIAALYTDACSGPITVTQNTVPSANNSNCSWSFVTTYTIKDACDNEVSPAPTYTYSGGDATAPVFTVPGDVTLQCSDPMPLAPVKVNSSPNNLPGAYNFATANFGAPITVIPVTGDAILVNDGTPNIADACQPILNIIAGKIAVIDRGTCNFIDKAFAAQNAGAIAVIIVNNIPGNAVSNMGTPPGPNPTITIPVIMVSNNYGTALKAAMAMGTVNLSLSNPIAVSDCSSTFFLQTQTITPGICPNNYTILNTWTAVDACGNGNSQSQTITVSDTQAPTLVGPLPGGAVGNVCQANAPAAPSVGMIASKYTDNCSGVVATLISTVPSGNNCAWSVTYTYSIKDACNNAAPNAVVVFTGGDTQAPTFTRPSDITILFSSPGVYNASPAATGDVTDEWDNCSVGLNATYTDAPAAQCGNNLVITRTWQLVDNCGNPAANQVQTITVTDNNTNYIIYAQKEAKFGDDNKIYGSVGVTDANGKAEFKKFNLLPSPYFVKAKNINIHGTANINNPMTVPATGGPNPPFQMYVATPLSGNYTLSVSGTVPAGNYKNLTIKKNVIATVNGCNYGKITIEEGASVTFNCSNMNIEELFVGKGKKGVNVTTVNFGSSTVLKVKDRVTIEEDCRINTNTGAPKVTFYLGDTKKDEENFMIKGDNTQVTANIMIPNGKLKIDKKTDDCIMTGWFIVEKLESTGQTTWNQYDCNAPLIAVRKPASSSDAKTTVEDKDAFSVSVYPNPSTTDFRILVKSSSEELVSVRIFDVSGRTVKVINRVQSNSYIRVGSELRQGSYFAEVQQGTKRQTVKLLKME